MSQEQKAEMGLEYGIDDKMRLAPPGLPVGAEGNEPEPPASSAPRAWIVAFRGLGLINVVGTSQAELAARFTAAAETPRLLEIEVLAHSSDVAMSTAWINPRLVQAVLNEFSLEPPPSIPEAAPEVVADVMAVILEEQSNE